MTSLSTYNRTEIVPPHIYFGLVDTTMLIIIILTFVNTTATLFYAILTN